MKKSIYLNKKTEERLNELSETYQRPKGEIINILLQNALGQIFLDYNDFDNDLIESFYLNFPKTKENNSTTTNK